MMKHLLLSAFCLCLTLPHSPSAAEERVSEATAACLECHSALHPGIVGDWKRGRMARTTPSAAKAREQKERRVSFSEVPDELKDVVVGCAECHTRNHRGREDSFEHNGFEVHTVVSPRDCAVCHPVESDQYAQNLMSHAHGNLLNNTLYMDLARSTAGPEGPTPASLADSCLHCHGTNVQAVGTVSRETDYGEMRFPLLSGWPNQGPGRVNPDKSRGACTPCHSRHRFSIEMARKPHTCSQCHKGPDVPAYKVYEVSKHGNIYASTGKSWNFDHVPWEAGRDFTAPTCASCHVSLVVSEAGEVVAERTHRMNDRLSWRIFGLIYAHPHPRSADTSVIRNKAGLPLPTELSGEPAAGFLISSEEQGENRLRMKGACLACHSRSWTDGHFQRYEETVKASNEMTLTATQVLLSAYERGAARGLQQNDSLFNETIEKKWVEQWLFFANSTRYASAMSGADYGVFANGRWSMAKNVQEMREWLEFKLSVPLKQNHLAPPGGG